MDIRRRSTKPEILFFDIESTDLKVPFGNMLCCSFVGLDHVDPWTFRLDKLRGKCLEDDSRLTLKVKETLEGAFCWVGWNSKLFDIAFLNARLTLHGIAPVEKRMHIDLMYYARPPFVKFYSSRLDAVAQTLELGIQKTDLLPQVWVAARRLDKDAMNYVVEHCEHDVLVLREIFKTFAPFIKNIHV